MRLLVTGVAGFIGSRIAAEALRRGHEVIGVDSFNDYYDPSIKRSRVERLPRKNLQVIEADLVKFDIPSILPNVDGILHQAGQPGVRQSWREGFSDYCERNVLLTQQLLEAVRQSQETDGQRPRVVFASSSSVYGDQSGVVDEATLPAPKSPYGVSKLAAENLCGAYARSFDLDVVSLRYFTVFGGGQRPDMAIQRLVRSVLSGEEFVLYGTGEQVRDFTHVEDVALANLAALERPNITGQLFNISGGNPVSLNFVIETLESITERSIRVRKVETQAGDVMATRGSTTLAQNSLGWTAKWDILEGLREQVAYEGS